MGWPPECTGDSRSHGAALAEYHAEQVRLTVHYVRVLAKQSGIEIDPP